MVGGTDGDIREWRFLDGMAGLTGSQDHREIPMAVKAPHGGGAFSGQRSDKKGLTALCLCRALSGQENVVAAGLAEKCTIQLRLCDGVIQALSIYCDTYGGDADVVGSAIEKAIARSSTDPTGGSAKHFLELNKADL